MSLRIRKHYAEFRVTTLEPSKLRDICRHVYWVDNLCVASSGGALYVFHRDKVSVYSSTPLNFREARSRIRRVTRSFALGKTTFVVFETSWTVKNTENCAATSATSATSPTSASSACLDLDFLHFNLSNHLPFGTDLNIFDPDIHPDLIVKVCPFKDAFTVTFYFKAGGKCLVVCDATKPEKNLDLDAFKCRVQHVMKSFDHVVQWG